MTWFNEKFNVHSKLHNIIEFKTKVWTLSEIRIAYWTTNIFIVQTSYLKPNTIFWQKGFQIAAQGPDTFL